MQRAPEGAEVNKLIMSPEIIHEQETFGVDVVGHELTYIEGGELSSVEVKLQCYISKTIYADGGVSRSLGGSNDPDTHGKHKLKFTKSDHTFDLVRHESPLSYKTERTEQLISDQMEMDIISAVRATAKMWVREQSF